MLEAMLQLDAVLEHFAEISPEIYLALGADQMPAFTLSVVKEGRR
jgi:hypothetical protein